jgi:hypothetical protein
MLETLMVDFVRFGFSAMFVGILSAILLPTSTAGALLITGGFALLFSGFVGVIVVKWWEYRQGEIE